MLNIFKFFRFLIRFFTNLTVTVQILLLISIFLLTAYSFFSLLELHIFDFAAPLSMGVHALMDMILRQPVTLQSDIDGTVFVACLFMAFIIWILSRIKHILDIWYIDVIDKIKKIERINDDVYLESVKEPSIRETYIYDSSAVIIKLILTDISIDTSYLDKNSFRDFEEDKKSKEKEVYNLIYKQLNNLEGCSFSRAGNNLIVSINDFSKTDKLLSYIDLTIGKLSVELKRERWELTTYVAVDLFDSRYPIKTCFPNLQGLINLRIPNKIICFEEFCNKYYKESDNIYEAFLKGVYSLPTEKNVWSLVKKS